ncbi:MAG: purine-nucleoside phosphorylase [Gemmatimonadota bacterium]
MRTVVTSGEEAASPGTPKAVARALRARSDVQPEALIVLGSGLGVIETRATDAVAVPFREIAGMPGTSVVGHAGRFVLGLLGGLPVLLQSGRFHAYEGHPSDVLALGVRVAAELGASVLVATNAAGGIRDDLEPGALVLIEDHVNLTGRNPLVGPVHDGETRFPDLTEAYDAELGEIVRASGERLGEPLRSGVYGAVLGPSYETPAEVRMLRTLGVDMVGMSTVPEVIAARARGMRCVAVSMVTNRAAGLGGAPLSHEEVLEVGERAGVRLARVLEASLERLAAAQSTDAK